MKYRIKAIFFFYLFLTLLPELDEQIQAQRTLISSQQLRLDRERQEESRLAEQVRAATHQLQRLITQHQSNTIEITGQAERTTSLRSQLSDLESEIQSMRPVQQEPIRRASIPVESVSVQFKQPEPVRSVTPQPIMPSPKMQAVSAQPLDIDDDVFGQQPAEDPFAWPAETAAAQPEPVATVSVTVAQIVKTETPAAPTPAMAPAQAAAEPSAINPFDDDDDDIFGEPTASDDPFADDTKSIGADPFESNDPFGSKDPFGDKDPFDSSDPFGDSTTDDPFATPPSAQPQQKLPEAEDWAQF